MNGAEAPGDLSEVSPGPKALPVRPILAALLIIHALLLSWSAAENSATFDEPMHLAAGAVYWKWQDLSVYSLSPPLLRYWAAVPAVLAGAKVPDPKPSHDYEVAMRHLAYVDDFVDANRDTFEHLLFLSRLGMIPISCLTALLVFRWAKDLYGATAGLAASALYCFNPSVLAHGSLVTTDLGTTTTMLWAAWLWWRFCRKPSFGRWVWVCIAILAAHLCKFTAVLLWPMMLGMAAPFAARGAKRWKTYLIAWVAAIPMTVILINASYGFVDSFRPLGSFQFEPTFMQTIQQTLPAGFRVPMPGVLVEGFDAQKYDTSRGYPAYLFGDIYNGVRWYYYPAALLCKTPLGMLALMLAAVATLGIKLPNLAPYDYASSWSMALGGIVFLAGVFLIGDVNIGTRYILPALPFALIITSRLWALPLWKMKPLARIRDGLLLLAAAEALFVGPYFISYINFAFGGPSEGWRLLSNSDFDWGQGLIALRGWMKDHDVDRVSLLYFGYIDPGIFGVKYQLPQIQPPLQYVAINCFYMQGLGNRMYIERHHREPVRIFYNLQLQQRKPVAVVADTIFIYNANDVLAAALEYQATHPPSPGH
jgi:hypothetical protein